MIFTQSLNVHTESSFAAFGVMQSRTHECWMRSFSSSLKDDLRYSLSDGYETFPFPNVSPSEDLLESVGETYFKHRMMLMAGNNEGMTKTYNRFHRQEENSEPIQRLRELHDEMDRGVLHAYGWHDLADELSPEFLTEETEDDHAYQGRYFWNAEGRDRVLARLLALNAERHAEEVRQGIAPKGSARSDEDEHGEEAE
jgi:hypothetical protein